MIGGLRSWPLRNTAMSDLSKFTLSASCWHNSTTKPLRQYHRNTIRQINQTDHNMDGIKRHIKPNTNPHLLAEEAGRQQPRDTHMTCNAT